MRETEIAVRDIPKIIDDGKEHAGGVSPYSSHSTGRRKSTVLVLS